jgi:hypothetical protein
VPGWCGLPPFFPREVEFIRPGTHAVEGIERRLSRRNYACFGRRVYAAELEVASESALPKLRISFRIAGDIALSSRSACLPSPVAGPLPFFGACFIPQSPFMVCSALNAFAG